MQHRSCGIVRTVQVATTMRVSRASLSICLSFFFFPCLFSLSRSSFCPFLSSFLPCACLSQLCIKFDSLTICFWWKDGIYRDKSGRIINTSSMLNLKAKNASKVIGPLVSS